ncbi:uncharacterized protein PV09_07594 [Verruconis gallopava]|uniref:Uncharacterized protein n=1 Tax=Verruconis gallopava TaxID=253628 RepID=A0A0D2ANY8_9PEZI|nr:uncharacterized protein PV09_07594 [Verruconis gallopava]KIW00834.1 hypothetical protein PV09_07594 [Verruconis gallopava]
MDRGEDQRSETDEPLPAYTPSDSAAQYDQDTDDEYNTDGGTGSSRGRYAKQVQRACRRALREVKKDNILANSDWAEPLEAAPTAISVMAFLIKTAADKKVAGLEVKSTKIMNEQGTLQVGTLPDIGRLAFLDAQKRMHKISVVARSMMKDGGRLSYIVELLENEEDAKDNLKPEMELLKKQAADCSKECEEIQKKFEYWYYVINHLSANALENIAVIHKDGEVVANSRHDAKQSQKAYSIEQQAILKSIEALKAGISQAAQKVLKAEKEVQRLNNLPPLPEPDPYSELLMAQQLAPEEPYIQRQRGFLYDLSSALFGMSKKQYHEDEDARDAHYLKQHERQRKIIEEARDERRRMKKQAKDERNAARNELARLEDELERKQLELANKRDRLSEAQKNLAKASADLERLDRQELELKDILAILQRSTNELGQLKAQLGRLVTFFSMMENNISKNTMQEVDDFLEVLNRNIKMQDDKVESIRLRSTSKRKILSSAMQIQGQVSAIADVSSAYVLISENYIRKAIDKMENLATIEDSKWNEARKEFTAWCNEAVRGINGITREASAKMGPNMQKRVGLLQTLAIEAAEDSNED